VAIDAKRRARVVVIVVTGAGGIVKRVTKANGINGAIAMEKTFHNAPMQLTYPKKENTMFKVPTVGEKEEYRMINSFNIENFRCFEQISLKDLRKINIIVGSNASGKTVLLEAIRLAAGATPEVMIRLNQARGITFAMPQNPTLEAFESIWSNMFFNQDTDKTISFSFVDSSSITRSLKVFFDKAKAFTSISVKGDVGPSNIVPLRFERSISGNKSAAYASIDSQGLPYLQASPELGPAIGFYSHSQITNVQEIARSFSQLAIRGKEETIVKTLQKVFPFVQGLAVLTLIPGQEGIYISERNSAVRVPATMISAGVNKFLSLIIGISSHRQGVTLVDEIDNGFYFKTLPEIWSILLKLAKECDGQIFASTHSWECLKAAVPTIREDVKAFTLIRTSKNVSECTAEVFRGDDVLSAIESDIEVR
jgi:predicted ATPase